MTTTATETPIAPAGTWQLDAVHSQVGFEIAYLSGTFKGQFREFDGKLVAEGDDVTLEGTVQVASVDVKDENLAAHLQSPDFFDAEQFPVMTFRSTSFDGETLTGDLTIKDVTKPVTFDVEFGGVGQDPWGNTKAGFEATTTVNRKDWGLEWNVALESGGVLVSEKVKLHLDVELVKA